MKTKSHRPFKDSLYQHLARIGKAVSSPRRLEILDLLSQAPRTVEALAQQSGQTLANTSQHLQRLRAARLVEARKEGLFVTYRLADEGISDFLRALRLLADSRLAEIERVLRDYVRDRDSMQGVDEKALIARIRERKVTLIDVRPAEEYGAGHIPGALSIPLPELERRLSELPPGAEVVAYCRGPYCFLAVDAVNLLRERGISAERLEHGIADWRALGFEVERG